MDTTPIIECTNCGGSGPDLQFWVTLGALLVAGIALAMNFVQFRAFLRDVRARARFKLTLRSVWADEDEVMRSRKKAFHALVSIGVKNEGDKAAGETLVNALVPRHLEHVKWCGPNGERSDETSVLTKTDDEKLTSPDGTEYEAMYLSRMLPRVGTKPHHLLHFRFRIEMQEPGPLVLPIRVKVQADEMPDDIEDYVKDLMVRVERLPVY